MTKPVQPPLVDPPITTRGWRARRELRAETLGVPELRMIGWTHFAETVMQGLCGHTHPDCYEFCYILRGNLTWWVERDIQEVEPNDIYITWPDEMHGGVDGVMHPAELMWIILELPPGQPALGLDADEIDSLLGRLNSLTHRRFQGNDAIADHYRRIFAAADLPAPLAAVSVRASLHLMLLDILAAAERAQLAGAGQRRYGPRVADAVDYMHRRLADTLSLDELADAVGLRPSYFREEFRRETGFSPVEFLTRLRVREARRLLVEGELPVTDVAFRLGFNSSQYFATVFRKHTGMTPSDFRSQAALGQTNARR